MIDLSLISIILKEEEMTNKEMAIDHIKVALYCMEKDSPTQAQAHLEAALRFLQPVVEDYIENLPQEDPWEE